MSLSCLSSSPAVSLPPGVSGGERSYGGSERESSLGLEVESGGPSGGFSMMSSKPALVDRIRVSDSASPSVIRMLCGYKSQVVNRNRN